MKKLSIVETDKMRPKFKGRGRQTNNSVIAFGKEILKLKIGESILAAHKELTLSMPATSTTFNSYLRRIGSAYKISFSNFKNSSEFLITRIK